MIQFHCPTCGQDIQAPESAGGNRWRCPQCQEVIRVPDHIPRIRLVPPPSVGDDSSGERIFLNERGIVVTSARFVVPQQTFAMSGITSTKVWAQPPNLTQANAAVILGIFVLAAGLIAAFGACQALLQAWDFAAFAVGFVLCAGFPLGLGTTLLWVGVRAVRQAQPRYFVIVCSAGGESRALVDTDERFIRRVAQAVTDAMIARG